MRRYSILPYVICGAFSAIAITFSIGQLRSADPMAGNLWELDAIAAVVIGGASLFGGRGSILGTLLGTLIMVMIRNGLNLLGVSPFWQGSAIGAIIIVALLIERIVSLRSARCAPIHPQANPWTAMEPISLNVRLYGTSRLPRQEPCGPAPERRTRGPATCATSAMAPSKS